MFGWVWVLFELALLHTVHDPPTLNLQCLLQGTDMSISPCNQEIAQREKHILASYTTLPTN